MEKNFEFHSAADDLLSQSYCNGNQKIAGTEDAITSDFHISGEILDKRKNAWNNFFEKYSTVVSEVELNIYTLQPEESMDPAEVMEQRLPMRKPMSMVQYWVDTGNLFHMNYTNNPVHSDSGSSIIEDNCCEPDQNNDSQSFATNPSAEKHSNIAETSGDKNLKIVTSSNSSVDTAAYILANNNITRKAETIAIVEGSKFDTETHSPVKANNNIIKKAETIGIIEGSKVDGKTHRPVKIDSQIIESSKKTNEISLARKSNHEKLKVANVDFSLFYKSCVEKINENIKIANFNKLCENKMNSKSKGQQNNICSIFFSDSDESICNIQKCTFENVLNENNQNNSNVSKFLKRKKLYNRSDSPAEFTPVSEDNLSLQTSNMILRKCLPLRKSEHPALDTPRTSSRFSTHARYRQTKFKRKLNRRQCLSAISTSDEKSETQELLDGNQNNVNSRSLYNSQIQNTRNSDIQTCSKKNCITDNNLMLSKKCSENHIPVEENVQNSMNRTCSHSSCDELFKNNFKLKSCRIVVQRLPYKYYLSRETVTKKKNLINSVTSKRIKNANKKFFNDPLTSNVDSINNAEDLPENTFNIKANNVKTFNNTKTFGDILNCREKDKMSLQTMSFNYSSSNIDSTENISAKGLGMTYNESLLKEKSKYMIADLSSDESDLIVTSKPVSKPRKSKKLPGKYLSYDECLNTSNKYSNQSFSKKRKIIMQKNGKNNDTDDDGQCFETKEHSFSHESRHKIPSRDCKKNKNEIKDTSSSSEEEISTPTKQKNQQVNSSVKGKPTIKSTCAIMSESKNTSNSICQVVVNRIQETNNNVDINNSCKNKLSEVAVTHGKTKTLEKLRNERELGVNDKSLSSGNSSTVSNSTSDKKKTAKIPAPSNAENSRNNPSKKSLAKQTKRQDKSQKTQDSTKVKTTIVQKTSTKKRKSLEIDLSSDEECIIPLKKKE